MIEESKEILKAIYFMIFKLLIATAILVITIIIEGYPPLVYFIIGSSSCIIGFEISSLCDYISLYIQVKEDEQYLTTQISDFIDWKREHPGMSSKNYPGELPENWIIHLVEEEIENDE